MYMVYWTVVEEGTNIPHAQSFDTADMALAMQFMEEL